MQQINAPRPPAWRDPARIRAAERERKLRPILILLSSIVLALLANPREGAYDEAISFQLARGDFAAWALFVMMGATLGYLSYRLWQWESRFAACAAMAIVLGLGIIACTDPISSTHNAVFVTMSLLIVVGHLGLFFVHLDWRLLPTTIFSLVGVVSCPGHLGIGERMLIASSLLALNVMVYGHLDP